MESIKNHIGQFALPTLLVLIIGAGAWAFLDSTRSYGKFKSADENPARRNGKRFWHTATEQSVEPFSFLPILYQPADAAVQSWYSPANGPARRFPVEISGVQRDTAGNASRRMPPVENVPGNNDSTATTAVHDTLGGTTPDSIGAAPDSVSLDSLKLSAWLQYLRPSQPQVSVFEPYQYPLFLYSGIIRHSATIDTNGKYVEIRETLLNHDIRVPLQIPLDEYIKLEGEHFVRSTWEELAHEYTLKEVGGLQSLMAGVTNISIPIPSNPVLSIFGPPRINLRISGAVDIHGGWRNQKLNAQTLSQLGNVTNQPDFKQDVQVNVSGTVGDKLNIGANWDTQNQFDYENQLKIKYTGYNDDIIKSVEAGNVSMSTPSSFIGSNQALFGIKTQMQLGPLTLTALASQQKAQSKTLTVSNGSSSQQFSLHAYQFATNHFFIDSMYIGGYETYLQKQQYSGRLYVTDYEVYISQPSTAPNSNLRQGYAVMNLPNYNTQAGKAFYDSLRNVQSFNQTSWKIESGRFEKLDPSQFNIDQKTGVLTLNTSFQSDQIVAIAFSTSDGQIYGTFSSTDTSNRPIVLNMIVPQNPTPSETDAWRLMLRNIYPTGGLNLDQNSLKNVQITYTAPGQSPQDNIDNVNLLQVFGLDKTGPNGSGPPDGQMDWNPPYDINSTTGEIIFPYLKPFVEAFNAYRSPQGQTITNPDSFTYSAVYDTTLQSAQNDFSSRDRFLITGTYTSSATSHYNLGFNLVEGSVKVLLNGQPLTAGVDYTIDYVTGEVDIKNQTALQSGANVQIQYETNDIFQIASKSLLGARADYHVNSNTDVGFTIMGYSRQSPNNKVRLGEEPISNIIMDADMSTSFDLPFVTKALNALPILQTAAPSKLSFHGEAAYMLPNPNTRKSVIPGDNGQGIAYIDDFEGAKKTIPLPITYSNWTMASPPAVSALDSLHPGIADSVKNRYRGWAYWYNRIPSQTSVKEIWPQRQVPSDQQTQTVLSVGFLPTVRGQYNRAKDLDTTLFVNPENNWGGMMTLLSSNASDLIAQNINYIEIWMKVDTVHGPGQMHIDLGQISEDIFGDRILHTEDTTGYGGLQSGLDLGLDLLTDAQERADFPWIVTEPDRPWDPNGTDPEGDNYYFSNMSNPPDSAYYQVNGTQGNAVTENGRLPDTEDLNHNGTLDLLNSYYEYNVKLDTTNNPFIAGGGSNGWYQYIIPLQDFQRAVGNPSLSNVQYVRIWFNGNSERMHLKIAEMNLVGNYWKTPNPNDSTMQVSVVNIEDNPGYTPPAPGLRPVDNSNPSGPVLGNEQSLALILNGLQDDSSRYVYKTFPQAQDFFNYHTMKVFVHGDPTFNYVDSTNYDASVYLRFGTDANNFYEYRQPIKRGWQDITIDFAALTSLKQKRDSVNQVIARVPADNGITGATYWVRGNPSLQNVTYFEIGVENPFHTGTPLPLVGQVWVDELRLTNVDNTPGWAFQLSSNLQLADLGSISFNYTNIDPYFHSLTTQFGSLNAQRNWGISGSFNLDRFLPRAWVGTSIPFYYNHTETFSNPLYLPNSDILVAEAVQRRRNYLDSLHVPADSAAMMADSLLTSSQTLTINDQWSISGMKIKLPSKEWYIRDIVDNVTMGFNWSGSRFRNTQTKIGTQWSWQYNAAYSVQFDPMAYFTPFPSKAANNSRDRGEGNAFQIRYLPNSFNLSMSASRSLTINKLWTQTTPIITPDFTAQRSGGLTWRLTNNGILNPSLSYNFNISSSLLSIETDTTSDSTAANPLVLRRDSYVFRQIFLNGGLINFGNDYNFSEQFALNTAPHLPFGAQKYMDLQASYNSGYQWTNSIQQGKIGKGAGFNASLQLGTTLRLKALTDPWFASASNGGGEGVPERGERGRRGREEFETTKQDSSSSGGNGTQIGKLLNVLLKIPFLDFDNIGVTFSENNTASNGGLPSYRPGMGNFFRIPFIQESDPQLGPSQLYQLGLVSEPYGELTMSPRKGFPFFGFSTKQGLRVGDANLTDNYSNSNTLDIRTSRNLWPGARINLTWHVGWSYNRNTTFTTDSTGHVIDNSTSTQISGQVSKSFFTIPPVLVFSMFKSGIGQVAADYQNLQQADPGNKESTPAQKISKAFVQGFETLPLLDKIFGQYFPRLNYSFSWSGLEALPLFKTFASQVSLNNAYQSTYTQSWHNTNGTGTVTDAQTISYGFQPLLGMNIAFKSFGNATISGSVLYNTSTQYALNPSANTIAQSYTGQLSITADYAKRGFSLPLFGLNFKNDIDVSASYSVSQTSRLSYSVDNMNSGGQPLDGTNQIAIELRFKYDISQRVTASIYYKNTRVVPTVPGSPIPGTTTNEAGVDVHISIAG